MNESHGNEWSNFPLFMVRDSALKQEVLHNVCNESFFIGNYQNALNIFKNKNRLAFALCFSLQLSFKDF